MMKLKVLILPVLLAATLSMAAGDFRYRWSASDIDGSRTGVTAPDKTDLAGSIGTVCHGKYFAPNGREFRGMTKRVAALVAGAQTDMARLREVIGYSPVEMVSKAPESALSNFTTDAILCQSEKIFGKKADVSLLNFGSIRINMPQGNVEIDDIISMFPFKNHLVLLTCSGKDIKNILKDLSATKIQPMAGMRMEIKDGSVSRATVGGEELDDEKQYSLVTTSFLLDGGDHLFLRKYASHLQESGMLVNEAIIDYIRDLTASGKKVEALIDGRVKYVD